MKNAKRSPLLWGSLALILIGLGLPWGYQVATGQPIGANTIFQTDAASGSAPAVRASGQDANISINIVPKGTGTVQVNGTPIAVSGGTVTSLTINPGPLAVTGTTNLTGPLFITPGTSVALEGVGARIFHNTADAPTTGTILETLYTFSVPANTLAVNGQSLRIKAVATTAANANNKTFLIAFGATTIISTGATAFNNDGISVECDIFRTGAATQKTLCKFETTENAAATSTGGAGSNFGFTVTTPAETLSGAVTINVQATTPTAAADLTARAVMIDWYAQGQ